jgi:hypothetical protein
MGTPPLKIDTVSSGRIVEVAYTGSTGTELSIGVDMFGNRVTVANAEPITYWCSCSVYCVGIVGHAIVGASISTSQRRHTQ